MKKAKSGKAIGPDRINNEMLIFVGETLHLAILTLFNSIMKSGKYPENWKLSIISPIHKESRYKQPWKLQEIRCG